MGGWNPIGGLTNGLLGALIGAGQAITATAGNISYQTYVMGNTGTVTTANGYLAQNAYYPYAEPPQVPPCVYRQDGLGNWHAEPATPWPQATEEQVRAELERQRQYRQAQEQAMRDAATAEDIARTLLLELLSEPQRRRFLAEKLFPVRGSGGGDYEIWSRELAGVPVFKVSRPGGRRQIAYCIHTRGIPPSDEMLGLKFMIEASEPTFLATANPSPC